MKKFFLGALAIAGLVACVQTEEVGVSNPTDGQIAFGGYVGNQSRATDHSTDLSELKHFTVWGYQTSSAGQVFDNELVKYEGGAWTYEGTQYWQPGHDYRFFAITPYELNEAGENVRGKVAITPSADPIVDGLGVITFENIEGKEDVLYASKTESTKTSIPEKVTFQFNHLLSKVKFTFTNGYDADYAKIAITNVTMEVPYKGTVTLDESVKTVYDWTIVGDKKTTLEFGAVANGKHLENTESAQVDNELLTIPADEKDNQTYKVTFDVIVYQGEPDANGDQVSTTHHFESIIADKVLVAGTAYNFTATIDAEALNAKAIVFDAAVDAWEQDGDTPIQLVTVSNSEELVTAINNGAKNIYLLDGEYTLAKYPAGINLIGVNDNAVLNVQDKTYGVNGNVSIENVKLVFSNSNYKGFQHTNVETYKNCTIVGQPFLYGNDVTFEGCTFEQTSADAYNVWTYGAKNVKFVNCVFNSAGKSVLIYAEGGSNGQNALFEGCTLNASAPVAGKAAIEIDSSLIKDAYNVVINNTTANGFAAGSVSGSTLYNNKKGTKTNVTVDGVVVVKLGYTYATTAAELAAALTANKENILVALTTDIECPIGTIGQNSAGDVKQMGGVDTKAITIDLNNHKLNLTTTYWSFIGAKNSDAIVTIKNGTMTSSQSTGTWNSYDLGFANCNYVIENVVFEKSIALSSEEKEISLKNVTINETHDYYAMWIEALGSTVTIDGLTVNSAGRGIKIDEEYIGTPKKVTLNIKDATFTTAKKAAILVKSAAGAEINAENLNIANVAADKVFAVWVDEDAAAHAAKVVVDGALVKVEGQIVNITKVSTVEGLKDALVAAGSAGAGNSVIELAAGEYTMSSWTPITVDGYHGADIVTIDGNGAVLKGMTTSLFNGGFAGGSGIVIKNLTIDGAAIVASNTQGYGAFVNCADSMAEITLINCHLLNSSIITPNDGANESRIGGLVGWTSGYSNQNDGPVKTYVNIKDCSVVGCTLKGFGSIGGICGHAGASDWTYTTIENCTVKNNNLISTDDGSWRVGVAVGTANVGEVIVNNLTESGNTLTQGSLVAPTGVRSYAGRLALGTTGSFVVDGVAITE